MVYLYKRKIIFFPFFVFFVDILNKIHYNEKVTSEETYTVAEKSKTDAIENDIVTKAAAGDDEALETIYEAFSDYIRYLSNKYYLAGAENKDLVQEGMIGLFKAIKKFSDKEGTSFQSFAGLCIERQMKSAIRAANRQKHMPLNSSVSLQLALSEDENKELSELFGEDTSNPEKIYIKNETYAQMYKLLYNSLTRLELQILLLHNKGLSYREISQISGKTVKSIDNAVQRIKKKVDKIREDYTSL